VSYLHREEKGSDVNGASHLLLDVMREAIDGAVVISNDSDLRFPIAEARQRVPVGLVNPSPTTWIAAGLKSSPIDGVGRHWWRQLTAADVMAHQLPDPAGGYTRPAGW